LSRVERDRQFPTHPHTIATTLTSKIVAGTA
jgi:hypothetical protein